MHSSIKAKQGIQELQGDNGQQSHCTYVVGQEVMVQSSEVLHMREHRKDQSCILMYIHAKTANTQMHATHILYIRTDTLAHLNI